MRKKTIIIYAIGLCLISFLSSYAMYYQTQQPPPTAGYIITLTDHQATIIVDNGNWTAIIPNPNGAPFQFHSSNYTEVIQWAMNLTR
jgi:hypothetical protein